MIVTHDGAPVMFHAQVEGVVVMVNEPTPPAAAIKGLAVALSEYAQTPLIVVENEMAELFARTAES